MNLPEKAWYTIQEVATRWNCSEDDVLYQINVYNLKPSFFFESVKCSVSKRPVNFDENTPITTYSGLVSLWLPDSEFCNKRLSYTRQWEGNLEGCLFIPGFISKSDNDFKILLPLEPTPITFNDILITLKELNRFETKALQEAIEDKAAEPAKENTRVIETLQKVLVAVAMDWYGYDPTAKGNTTVKDILGALDKIGLSLSENTIRKHLKAGAQLIPRDKA